MDSSFYHSMNQKIVSTARENELGIKCCKYYIYKSKTLTVQIRIKLVYVSAAEVEKKILMKMAYKDIYCNWNVLTQTDEVQ